MPAQKPIPTIHRVISGLLRFFFSLLYHQFAFLYDTVAWIVSLGRWKDWVLTCLPYLGGPNILEIGHGPGHLQQAIASSAKLAVGVDESWQMNRIAYRRLVNHGERAMLVNGYAQNLPFRDDHFHQVVATFPTEFILNSNSLDEIYRVLVPAGILIVLPVAVISGDTPLQRFAAWLFRSTRQSPDHIDSQVLDELSRPFNERGFETMAVAQNYQSSLLVHILARKPPKTGVS